MRFAIEATNHRKFMSLPSARVTNGGFPCKITASVSIHNIGSRSLECSNVFTASPITPAPVWDSRFANELWSASGGAFGLNLSSDEVQRFYLRSRAADALEAKTHQGPASIVLVEDNPADAGLVREALEEHDIECELIVISDGELAV